MSRSFRRALVTGLLLLLLFTGLALAYGTIVKREQAPRPAENGTRGAVASGTPPVSSTATDSRPPVQEGSPTHTLTNEHTPNTPTSAVGISATPSPSTTSSPTPSHTPMTNTPDAIVCSLYDFHFQSATSNIGTWFLDSPMGVSASIVRIELSWPEENEAIFNAFLNGDVIWSGGDLVAPTIMVEWVGEPDNRRLAGIDSLEFLFGTNAAASGYDVLLRLDNNCELTTSN